MTEDQLEKEALEWLSELGYTHLYGPDIAHDGSDPQRETYRQVVLTERLRAAIAKLNPAREDALKQVRELGVPAQLSANRRSIACWSAACRCSTRSMGKPGATSYG